MYEIKYIYLDLLNSGTCSPPQETEAKGSWVWDSLGYIRRPYFAQLKKEGKGRGSKKGKKERKIDYKNGKNEKSLIPEIPMN